jgi:hypothetical protein
MNCWLGEVSEGRGAFSAASQLPLRAESGLAGVSFLQPQQTKCGFVERRAHFQQVIHCKSLRFEGSGYPTEVILVATPGLFRGGYLRAMATNT